MVHSAMQTYEIVSLVIEIKKKNEVHQCTHSEIASAYSFSSTYGQ